MTGIFRSFLGTLLIGGMGGCASLVGTALPVHKGPFEMPEDIKQLCEAEGGIKVYETVENVESVVVLPWIDIVNGKRQEGGAGCGECFGHAAPASHPSAFPVRERYYKNTYNSPYRPLENEGEGYYRYDAVARPSEKCEPFDRVLQSKRGQQELKMYDETVRAAVEDTCVVAAKIGSPTSSYSLQTISRQESRMYGSSSMGVWTRVTEFRRRSDGKLIAKRTSFSVKLSGYVNDPSAACPEGPSDVLTLSAIRSGRQE